MELSKFSNSFFLALLFHVFVVVSLVQLPASRRVQLPLVLGSNSAKEMVIQALIQKVIRSEKKLVPVKKVMAKPIAQKKHFPKKVVEKSPVLQKRVIPRAKAVSGSALELAAIEKYAVELRRYIDKSKFYPRMAKRLKQSGDLELKITVSKEGMFERIILSKKSRFSLLNNAAKTLVQKLKKFRPLPGNLTAKSFRIPVRYKL